jgi:hypothetical protein
LDGDETLSNWSFLGWFKDQPEKAKPHFDDWKANEELTDQVTCHFLMLENGEVKS